MLVGTSQGAIVRGQLSTEKLFRGNCPGGKSLWGNCPRGNFMGGIVLGAVVQGGNVWIPFKTSFRNIFVKKN